MPVSTAALAGRRCIVLGAAGFIGTNLCKGLLATGARVLGLDCRPANDALPSMDERRIRFEESAKLESLLEPDDLIFHLVSTSIPGSQLEPDKEVSENLIPSLRLLQACVRKRVGRLVFLSSGGTVYGPDAQLPTPEDAAENPISWYGVQKVTIEKYLAVYRRLHHLDSVVLRVSNPFGPHQSNPHQGLVASVLRHALTETPVDIYGDGLVTRDYVYITDVVEAILLAAAINDPALPRIYNIGAGIGRSVNDVVHAVQSVHGRPVAINRLPSRSIDVPVSILDISRAATHLSWRPTTEWGHAIRLTYTWAKSKYAGAAES